LLIKCIGLGPTVPELGIAEFGIVPVEKTQFSMVLPQIMDSLKNDHAQVHYYSFAQKIFKF